MRLTKLCNPLLRTFHTALSLPAHPASWHTARLASELLEPAQANTPLSRLSETCDVLFTISRAHYSGHTIPNYHPEKYYDIRHVHVWCYMALKFSSRFWFYRVVARGAGKRDWWCVREVVNPGKREKVREVAGRHGVEGERMRRATGWVRCFWPLLP